MEMVVIMGFLHHRLPVHDFCLVTREQSSNKCRVGHSRPPNPHTRTVNKKNTTSGRAEPLNSMLPRSGYWFAPRGRGKYRKLTHHLDKERKSPVPEWSTASV